MTSLHDAGHGRASFELQSPTPPGLPSSKDTSDTCIAQQVAGQDKDLTADVSGDPEAFSLAHPQHKRWNHPRANVWRTFACFLGLLIMGMNDAAYGVSSPEQACSSGNVLIDSPGLDSLCTFTPVWQTSLHTLTRVSARDILQNHLYNSVPGLPLPTCWLHGLRPDKQPYPHDSWPKRCCFPRTRCATLVLYNHFPTSSVPSPSPCFRPRWLRQWPRRCCLECLDREYAKRK